MSENTETRMNEIREIVAEVLEIEPDEITPNSLFIEEHDADSLRAIEILARLEKKYSVEIPQNELAKMTNLSNVYGVLQPHTGWGK